MIRISSISAFLWFSIYSAQCFSNPAVWAKSYELEAKGNYKEAAEMIKHYTKNKATAEFAFMRTAWLCYLSNDYNCAIKNYNSALKLNKDSIDTRVALLSPLAAQNRWKEVALVANKILEVDPWNYQAHLLLMQSRNNTKSWVKLKKQAKKLVVRYPTKADPWVFLARAYHRNHKVPDAISAYRQVLRRYPTNAEAAKYIDATAN